MSLSCTISEILSLISQNFKLSCDPAHIPFGGNLSCMRWYSSVSNSTRNLKCIASTIKKYDWGKLKNESSVPDHSHYGQYVIQRLAFAMFYGSTCVQYLATLASAVPEIWLWVSKLKMCHVTTTTPILGVIVIWKLGVQIFYICAKFDDSNFSRFRHINAALKFKMDHVTLTTHRLRVICHPYAKT